MMDRAHSEALEADLQREYGIDYRWALKNMGARRLLALARNLSPRSATVRAFFDGQDWSTTDELLAVLIEQVDLMNRNFIRANSKPNSRQPEPLHIPRPLEKNEPEVLSTAEGLRLAFGEFVEWSPPEEGENN